MLAKIGGGESTRIVHAAEFDQREEKDVNALLMEEAVRKLSLPALGEFECTTRIARKCALRLNEVRHLARQLVVWGTSGFGGFRDRRRTDRSDGISSRV